MAAFVWVITKIVERLALLPATVDEKRASAAKARAEARLATAQAKEIEARLRKAPYGEAMDVITKRLGMSTFQIEEIDLTDEEGN